MLNNLNIDALNCWDSSQIQYPAYAWIDSSGHITNLSDRTKFMVLREGINGFSNCQAEYQTEQAPNMMADILKTINIRTREFGFAVVILGTSHANYEAKRRELLTALSASRGEGALIRTFDNGTSVTIKARISRGYPDIRDGMSPQGKSKVADIQFTAVDPYFYSNTIRVYGDADGNADVYNAGDAIVTPCKIWVSSSTSCKNLSTGLEMKNMTDRSIADVFVDVSDKRVRATLNGTQALNKFSYDSQFWMLGHGLNKVSGIHYVEFQPRWQAV